MALRFIANMSPVMRNILIITIAGLVIRYVLGFFLTYPRDFGSWILNAENFMMNEGVYGLPGHYYTPVWGYMMASMTYFASAFGMPIGFMDPFYDGSSSATPWNTMLPTIEFALMVKTILFVCEIFTAYALFRIVMHITGDEKKATVAYALWFLFPLVIVLSSIRVMFECVEIMFAVWAILFMMENRPAYAGVMIGLSLMTKPYGIFLAVLLIGYAYARRKCLMDSAIYFGVAVVTVLVVMLPVILSGQLDESLHWLTTRVDKVGEVSYYNTMYLIPIACVISLIGALVIAKHRILSMKVLMGLSLITTGFLLVNAGNVQYYLILLPFAILFGGRLIMALVGILLLMSSFAAVFFTSESLRLYNAYGFWGCETLNDFGKWLYPIESKFDYSILKTASGYASIIIPSIVGVWSMRERRRSSAQR